jgi:2,3-bisphosphoglycerate-dependent phosphoglycerate mutase
MSTTTTLFLVRHAESAPDFSVAESDWPLSAIGRAQATRLAEHARSFAATRLIASPYRRAIETLEPTARTLGLPIEIAADLRERHLRDGYVENWDALLVQLWRDLDAGMPNCETGTQCRYRVARCIDAIATAHAGETLVACSHGNAITLFLGTIDRTVGYDTWKRMQMPDVFRLHRRADRWHWDRDYVRPWA